MNKKAILHQYFLICITVCMVSNPRRSYSARSRFLDDVFKSHGGIQHHGLLAGDHLLVYRVVKVSNLKTHTEKRNNDDDNNNDRTNNNIIENERTTNTTNNNNMTITKKTIATAATAVRSICCHDLYRHTTLHCPPPLMNTPV